MNLSVINTHTYNCFYFFFYKLFYKRVIIPFMNTAYYQNCWMGHALQSIPCTVYIGGFAIVYKFYAFNCCNRFHAMLQAFKCLIYIKIVGWVMLSKAYHVLFTLVALLSFINSTPLIVATGSMRCSRLSNV